MRHASDRECAIKKNFLHPESAIQKIFNKLRGISSFNSTYAIKVLIGKRYGSRAVS